MYTVLCCADAPPAHERDRGQGRVSGQRGEADPLGGHAGHGGAQAGAQEGQGRGGQDLQGRATQGQGANQVGA